MIFKNKLGAIVGKFLSLLIELRDSVGSFPCGEQTSMLSDIGGYPVATSSP